MVNNSQKLALRNTRFAIIMCFLSDKIVTDYNGRNTDSLIMCKVT